VFVNVLYVFGDVFYRRAIPLITLVWVTILAMKSAHIALLNHTKEMNWRNAEIWQVMMGVMIAKRKIIHVEALFFI